MWFLKPCLLVLNCDSRTYINTSGVIHDEVENISLQRAVSGLKAKFLNTTTLYPNATNAES